ncbi:MAG: hypothetical protein COB08_007180 [Rhodobacteraceae bacterium]|nr:hypothetical protein [Paracoccaceae bacterium]
MTKPLPSLALDMSQDGIALHQLAFDGHWHEMARVALNDPALRARLSNMRSVAAKLEGRRFKTQIWLPENQILQDSFSLFGNDEGARVSSAREKIAEKFGGKPKDYAVQLGKRAEGGAYTVAAVRVRTMHEARTFASSHGFRAKIFSTQSAVNGFATPPVFLMPVDRVKTAGLGLVAATAATLVLGGGIAFYTFDPLNMWETPPKTSDFAPFQQPNPGIERAGSPPIPSAIGAVPIFSVMAGIGSVSVPNTLPYLPPRQLTADAQETIIAPTSPSESTPPEALQLANEVLVNWPATIAILGAAPQPDPLPSIGLFSLQDRIAALNVPVADTPPAPPSGPMPAYRGQPRPMTVANTSFYLEPLPATATRLSPDALAEFITRTGLTMAQLSRLPAPLLLISSKVVKITPGLPPILPRLRSGRAIPAQTAPPPEPPVVLAPTGLAPLFTIVSGKPNIIPPLRPAPPVIVPPQERLPFALIDGAPDLRPRFRPAPEVAETPDVEDATQLDSPIADEPVIAEAPAEVVDTSLAAAVDAAIESASTTEPQLFALLEGQPALLPRLRSGAEIPPVAQPAAPELDPATAEANALRPRRRPQAIVDLPAPIDPMISGAAPISATRPNHRSASFAANAARIIEIATSRPRVTAPAVPTDPQTVNLPTSASVARSATIENAINLRKTNLLGIFGTADNRTALIRLAGGRNIRVQLGQSFSGWTVVAISENTVRIRKRSREEILRMPAE